MSYSHCLIVLLVAGRGLASEPAHDSGGEDHGGHDFPIPYIILFVILCLFLGNIAKSIKEKTSLPYSPQLLVFGVVLGCFYPVMGDLGKAV